LDTGRAAVRLLAAYWDGWYDAFPSLHRRAHWHIVHHLCAQAPQVGAPLGELLGLTRQALLLDDATVRDRIADLVEQGACTSDPADAPLAARTIVIPTASLLTRYDATLTVLLAALDQAAPDLQPGVRLPPAADLPPSARALALEALVALTAGWTALLERLFDASPLSSARRVEARRNLLSTSHRTLLLTAIEHHYGMLVQPASAGILADRMAAAMLERTGQNFQTTRDHLAYLLSLGLLQRCPGRALSVALAASAVPHVHAAMAEIASGLTAMVRRAGTPEGGTYALRITAPADQARLVLLDNWPFTIGRTEANTLCLAAGDVSRAHCQITLRHGQIVIADLQSTNGTVVNGRRIAEPAELTDGAVIRIGLFEMIFLAPEDMSDSTIRHTRGGGLVTRA
jgi:hypothetical protein